MKFHARRNVILSTGLQNKGKMEVLDNFWCETGIKFNENISAELELLEFPIANGRTYTFWQTRDAEGADA